MGRVDLGDAADDPPAEGLGDIKQITYVIDDGVRRAKAAQLAGREFVPIETGSGPEQDVPIGSLLSRKVRIALDTPEEKSRWEQIMKEYGPGGEPDLLPPIQARLGTGGIAIEDVKVG